jgi:hypothetical protein
MPTSPTSSARVLALLLACAPSACRTLVVEGAAPRPEAAERAQNEGPFSGQLQGIDPDGRIPKVPLPADVPHPERWRYKPEGRISDGSILERFLTSTFIAPILFFSSDVGTGAGFALTDIDFRNQRRREFANTTFTYTTEGQQRYAFLWRRWLDHRDLTGGGVIQEERSFVQAFAGYRRTLTRRFFGIGPESRKSDESSFTDEVSEVEVELQQSVPAAGDDWVIGAGLRLEHRNLSTGFVGGVPRTSAAFPAEFADGDDLDSLWIDASLRYDSRDSQANPYRGGMLALWGLGTPLMTGGRSGVRYGVTGTYVHPVPNLLHGGGDAFEENPPTDVVAVTAALQDSGGELPFWALPSLGGDDRLRGYIANRFVDRASWFAGIEHRIVVVPRGFALNERVRVERLGLALFYELGSVAPDLSSLGGADVKHSWGLSGRLNLERAATFRLDLGFAEDSSNFTLTYGLSF